MSNVTIIYIHILSPQSIITIVSIYIYRYHHSVYVYIYICIYIYVYIYMCQSLHEGIHPFSMLHPLVVLRRYEVVIGLTTLAYRYEGLRREDFDEVLGGEMRISTFLVCKAELQHELLVGSGWWCGTCFFFLHVPRIILPTDFHVFQEG